MRGTQARRTHTHWSPSRSTNVMGGTQALTIHVHWTPSRSNDSVVGIPIPTGTGAPQEALWEAPKYPAPMRSGTPQEAPVLWEAPKQPQLCAPDLRSTDAVGHIPASISQALWSPSRSTNAMGDTQALKQRCFLKDSIGVALPHLYPHPSHVPVNSLSI